MAQYGRVTIALSNIYSWVTIREKDIKISPVAKQLERHYFLTTSPIQLSLWYYPVKLAQLVLLTLISFETFPVNVRG